MKKILFLFLLVSLKAFSASKENSPNVLFVVLDDLRPTLGAYDYPEIITPNIDNLAKEGVMFTHSYCNVPVCGASRASLLTGIRPRWPERFINWKSWAEKDAPGVVSLPKHFQNNGYTTVSNGKIFHHRYDMADSWTKGSYWPDTFTVINYADLDYTDSASIQYINPETGAGPYFECSSGPELYFDNKVLTKSLKDLETLATERNPFFLAVGFHKPHLPFNAPKRFFDLYDSVQIAKNRFRPFNLPEQVKNSREIFVYGRLDHYNSNEFHYEARKAYYACVSYVDDLVGQLLSKLKALKLDDNTIVILIGDHGYHLGEHNFWGKHNVLHNALHTPMIISAPGVNPKKVNEIVEFVDIYPTLAELAGVDIPIHLQGESMVKLMRGNDPDWKNIAICEWEGAKTILSDRYSYSYWYKGEENDPEMLFDHYKDPEENFNIVKQEEYIGVVKHYRSKIDSIYSNFR